MKVFQFHFGSCRGTRIIPLVIFSAFMVSLGAHSLQADPQPFAFLYDGDPMGKGGVELEQYFTYQHRTPDDHTYQRLDLKTELEFGLTDNVDLKLYLFNYKWEDDSTTQKGQFDNAGVELLVYLLNQSSAPISLAVGGEALVGAHEIEFEHILILQKDFHDWSFCYNLKLETEIGGVFSNNSSDVEVEGSMQHLFGVSRRLSDHLFLGAEARVESVYLNWSEYEKTDVHVGPAIHWNSNEHFWLSVTPLFKLSGAADSTQFEVRTLVGWNF